VAASASDLHVRDGVHFCLALRPLLKVFHQFFYVAPNLTKIQIEILQTKKQLECGPMPNLMVTLLNIGGALCSTPQSLSEAHY